MRHFLLILTFLPLFLQHAQASENIVCQQLETARKHLKTHVAYSELKDKDHVALDLFKKAAQEECADEACHMCQIQAHEQAARLHEKYERDKEAFENYLKAAQGYLKVPPVLFPLSSNINRRLAAYYAEGKVTKQNYEKAYYWLILGKGRNVTVIGTMPNGKTTIEEFKKEVLANLSEEQIELVNELNKSYLEKLAQQQRNNFATRMELATLGFSPNASLEEKANARLSFELGLNKFHYDLEGVKKLIHRGALNNKPHPNSVFLFSAQEKNDLDLLDLLIENDIDLNSTDSRGFTVLHRAIGYGHTDFAIRLIEAGADLSVVSKSLKDTPLMAASGKGNLTIVKALIDGGADVNQIVEDSQYYKNALEKALHFKYYTIARYLTDQGAETVSKYKSFPDPIPLDNSKCPRDKKTCADKSTVSRNAKTCEFPLCPEPRRYDPAKKITGTFSEIDTELSSQAIFTLHNGREEEKKQVMREIKANPEYYNPVALNALSRTLFSKIEDQDAAFWYMAAFLRRRHDALICKDDTSSRKMHSNPIVHQFRPYAENNKQVIEGLLPKVLEWDRTTPYNYDSRWINIGTRPSDNKLTDKISENLCVSEDRKEEFREQNRTMYAQNMQRFTQKLDYSNPPQNDWPRQEEFDALLKEAESGDAEAQFQIVDYKYLKLSPAKTKKERGDFVEKWLKASVEQQHAPAIALLGKHYTLGFNYYYRGHGGKPQTEKGLQMLQEAGAQGYSMAYFYIGEYYRHIKNPVEAYAWFSVCAALMKNAEISAPEHTKTLLAAELRGEDWIKAQKRAQEYLEKYTQE